MAVALNTTTYPITRNSNVSKSLNVKTLQLGDGYDHTEIDGINYERESWPLDFLPQSAADSLTLEALLLASQSGTANILSWTPPNESTTKYWRAYDVKRGPVDGTEWKVTCTLKRCYPI